LTFLSFLAFEVRLAKNGKRTLRVMSDAARGAGATTLRRDGAVRRAVRELLSELPWLPAYVTRLNLVGVVSQAAVRHPGNVVTGMTGATRWWCTNSSRGGRR
jgi:hypothetical protein